MNTHFLLFGLYPYIALAVCVIGCIARFDRDQYTWKTGSSQMLRSKGMRLASNAFHIGVLFILAGHFVGLLTPHAVYEHFISTENKQLLAMVAGGIAGVVCFVGLAMLIVRRMTDPRIRANSTSMDMAILWLLMAQLLLGLSSIVVSTQHMDGSVMVMLANWAQHIVTLQPVAAAQSIESGVHIIYKLHIFLGLTLVLITPFSRLVHAISAPVWYLFRTGYQIVRVRG
jgi:nitrate reductase gamma subunit